MRELVDYFQNRESAYAALERYFEFSKNNMWDVGGSTGKISLYSRMFKAIDPGISKSESFDEFRVVYDMVRSWPGVERGGKLAPAKEVHEVILKGGNEFFFGSRGDLMNITFHSEFVNKVNRFLPALQFVKQTSNYPWMPVSKILHFVNPGLFPIWDWTVVWNTVMYPTQGAFGSGYRDFCHKHGFNVFENRPVFLLNYMLWAAHHIQQGDASFMEWFADWMNHHFSNDIIKYNLGQKVKTLYATAFEFVAIGAAYLEK